MNPFEQMTPEQFANYGWTTDQITIESNSAGPTLLELLEEQERRDLS